MCFVMIASLGWRGFFGLNTFDSAAGALAPRVSLIYLDMPDTLSEDLPAFWREGLFRVFLTHLASEKAFACELRQALLNFGISAFVAHNDIKPTLVWQTEIIKALNTCEAVVALMHFGFHANDWTDQEMGFAMGRGVPVFAVRFGETPYGFIGRFQALNGRGKSPSELARELYDLYRENEKTQKRMNEVLVKFFEKSPTIGAPNTRNLIAVKKTIHTS